MHIDEAERGSSSFIEIYLRAIDLEGLIDVAETFLYIV